MPEFKYFVYAPEVIGEPNPRLIGKFTCLEHAVIFIEGYYNRYYMDNVILVISKGEK